MAGIPEYEVSIANIKRFVKGCECDKFDFLGGGKA